MLDDVFNLMLELVVIFLDLLKAGLLIPLEVLDDLEESLGLFLFCSDDSLQDGDVCLVEAAQVTFPLVVDFPLLGELCVVVGGEFLDASSVAVVIVLELIAQVAIFVDEAGDFGFSLLAAALETVISLFNLVFFLFDFIDKALHLGLVQVAQLILVLLMLTEQVVSHIFVLCFYQIQLVGLLLVQFLELVATIIGLHKWRGTSAFISSLLRRSWRFKFSISKFFSSITSFSLRILSS